MQLVLCLVPPLTSKIRFRIRQPPMMTLLKKIHFRTSEQWSLKMTAEHLHCSVNRSLAKPTTQSYRHVSIVFRQYWKTRFSLLLVLKRIEHHWRIWKKSAMLTKPNRKGRRKRCRKSGTSINIVLITWNATRMLFKGLWIYLTILRRLWRRSEERTQYPVGWISEQYTQLHSEDTQKKCWIKEFWALESHTTHLTRELNYPKAWNDIDKSVLKAFSNA